MLKAYAGIGSRRTPPDVLILMSNIARDLGDLGWTLRSGHAQGADQAFEAGARKKEIFLPWRANKYNSLPEGHIVAACQPRMVQIAARHHPNWAACSEEARKRHTRNVCQVLGEHGNKPSHMVICWTEGGRGDGGTGQAIRVAASYDIPVFDLALEGELEALIRFINEIEGTTP